MNKKQLKFLESKGIDINELKGLRGSKESQHSKDIIENKILTQSDIDSIETLRSKINEKLKNSSYSFGVYFHKK